MRDRSSFCPRRRCSTLLSRLAGFCAVRSATSALARLASTHEMLPREMNEVALGKTAPTSMRDVAHAPERFDAADVITASEGEQCLTERQHKRVLWKTTPRHRLSQRAVAY